MCRTEVRGEEKRSLELTIEILMETPRQNRGACSPPYFQSIGQSDYAGCLSSQAVVIRYNN